MPNGYTSKIYNNERVTPTDFLVDCARGMGYFMHMRDSSSDAPLTRNYYDSSEYHQQSLDKAWAARQRWDSLSEEEKYAEWSEYYNTTLKENAEREAEKGALRARYLRMIAEVTAYEVEPLMESTKEFALKMLNESMEFDCPSNDSHAKSFYAVKDYISWCVSHGEKLSWYVNYHRRELDKAQERKAEYDRYLDAFEKSFGIEVK